jgi:macrolide transport system ATP-binding/permease protein
VPTLQTRLSATLRQWIVTRPKLLADGGRTIVSRMHVVVVPAGGGIQSMQNYFRDGLRMLMILSSIVLIIACANIANLMLARSTARRTDVAVRMALGAGRGAIVRQIVTESVVLSLIGGAVGVGIANIGARTILSLAFPEARNIPISAAPSPAILGFAFLASLVTGILFGAAPAWLLARSQPADMMRGAGRSTRDHSGLPQRALVVFQVALSIVLLTGAILMTRSLGRLEHQDFGVATENRYVLHIDPAGAGYSLDRLPGLYRQLEERFRALPGLNSFSMAMYSPLEDNNWGECVIQQGHPAPGPNERCGSTWVRVSPGFLSSVGVPIVHGRDLSDHDTANSPQVAIVNEAFVKRFFPGKDPIGQRFGIDMTKYSGSWQIVGVFRDFKINNPRREIRPVYLRPLAQRDMSFTEPEMTSTESSSMIMQAMIIGFDRPQPNADQLIRQTLASVDRNLTVMDLRTFSNQVAGNFDQERLLARLSALFGILALVLACVGLYGVMSYFVARRTSEVGIRMALGASRSSVIVMVMRGVAIQVAVGLALGIPAALYAGHLMKSMLYNTPSYDVWALVGAPMLLILCAALAGFIPARRAATIEPMQALRTE